MQRPPTGCVPLPPSNSPVSSGDACDTSSSPRSVSPRSTTPSSGRSLLLLLLLGALATAVSHAAGEEAAPPAGPIRVLAFGDSLTEGLSEPGGPYYP